MRLATATMLVSKSTDIRRTLSEATVLDGDQPMRFSIITVAADADDRVVLGNHYHPEGCDEYFTVVKGKVWLYWALSTDLGDVQIEQRGEGGLLVVPGLVVHRLDCEPGTILHVFTPWEFTEDKIIKCPLNLG